ncbi:Transposon Ty3-G Gag-Pol polyprotein [Araneus ventricosus]|uniref:Transposon Ty3-G Gag-Pol polyprotein n=1 Tax=Araneus ventricosus TaxID=182803 RepID=A0A4Y2L150_ARAVE|nr:Transposon Ty3-G Gag-Pol polyprotein [Araneus ventricosus]
MKNTRLCIDYRKLNAICKTGAEPLPRIDTLLDKLTNAKIFSTLDLASGYWHIPLHEKDKEKLAFVTNEGLYEFQVLPFGFRNSPAIFNRTIRRILNKHKCSTFACHYFDDIVIFSNSLEEHYAHLEQIFKICEEENIKLKFSKCVFAKDKINFLGYEIKEDCITPDNHNIESIKKLRLQKMLKNKLVTKPVLQLYYPKLPLHVFCDAFQVAIGAVLKQPDSSGNLHPMSYHSRTLRSYEKNYCIKELECLAIVDALDKFYYYLHGQSLGFGWDSDQGTGRVLGRSAVSECPPFNCPHYGRIKEITHAFVSLSDLSLDSSIFQESLKDSKRQNLWDDETVRLDDTQFSAAVLVSGEESANEDEGEEGADEKVRDEGGEAPKETNGQAEKGSERTRESEATDPGLTAILERATALLTERGLDDKNSGKVLGLIFEAFGLRTGSMSQKAKAGPNPVTLKRTKSTRGKTSKSTVAPQNVKGPMMKDAPRKKPIERAAEQPKSAPQSFASAAQKGASAAQNPPVRSSAPSTKKAPPGRTALSKAKRSGVTLVYPKEDSGLSTSSQVLRCLERNISLGALGVKMNASRPIHEAGMVLVTETKPMTETLRQAIEGYSVVADKVSVRAPKGRVPHIIVYNNPIGKYATRDKEEKWIRRLRKGNNLPEGDISVRFRQKAKNGTENWILALAPEVFRSFLSRGV